MRRLVLVAVVLAAGCSRTAPGASTEPGTTLAAAAPKVFEAPKPAEVLAGLVLEQVESGPYSLLRLKTATGEAWAAVPRTSRKVGDQVTLLEPLPVQQFESKPLKRTFALVYVGNLG